MSKYTPPVIDQKYLYIGFKSESTKEKTSEFSSESYIQSKTEGWDADKKDVLDWWISFREESVKERPGSETALYSEWAANACCLYQLSVFTVIVGAYAGLELDDREKYLAKLRPLFSKRAEELKGKPICSHREDAH